MNFHSQIFLKTVVDEVLPHSLSRIMYSARTIYCAHSFGGGGVGGSFGSFDQNKILLKLDP